MYGQYIAAVVRRAFHPTARFTDVLQILAASAAPAVAKFLGLPVPSPEDTLAYIGAAALAFVGLRLFFVAPYQVWRDQVGEIATLKLELSKPERMEIAHISKIRAKARVKLAKAIRRFQHLYFIGEGDGMVATRLDNQIVRLHAEVSPSPAFTRVYTAFHSELRNLRGRGVTGDEAMEEAKPHARAIALSYFLGEWLHGRITDEVLLLQLLANTEQEKQP